MKAYAITLLIALSTLMSQALLANGLPVQPDTEMSLSADGKININTASAESLALILKGVGIKKAHAIVEYRTKFGRFEHVTELGEVSGIGESILQKNSNRISVE